jgi:hypothetical protein
MQAANLLAIIGGRMDKMFRVKAGEPAPFSHRRGGSSNPFKGRRSKPGYFKVVEPSLALRATVQVLPTYLEAQGVTCLNL